VEVTKQRRRIAKIPQLPAFSHKIGAYLETSRLSYQFGEFTLDIARGCLLRAGAEIKLRPKVYETLKYLVEHPGQLIGKQELMQAVWPKAFVTDDAFTPTLVEFIGGAMVGAMVGAKNEALFP
jgi:DNA-binding response OmpR family regulator